MDSPLAPILPNAAGSPAAEDPAAESRALDLLQIARSLTLLQAAILMATTLEALVWSGFFGPAVLPSAVLSFGSAVLALACTWGLGRGPGRRARWARRWTVLAEGLVIAIALVDVALGLAIAGSTPGLVAVMTRLALPFAVIVLLRRPGVRARIWEAHG